MNKYIREAINVAKKKFGHSYSVPDSDGDWFDSECIKCGEKLRLYSTLRDPIIFLAGVRINTVTWDVFDRSERQEVICRKFEAFL